MQTSSRRVVLGDSECLLKVIQEPAKIKQEWYETA